MHFRTTFLSAIILAVTASIAAAQQFPFQNLDFEQATVESAASGVPWDAQGPLNAAAALPDWTVTEDTTTCNVVWSSPGLDETSVALCPSASAIDGNFSVALTSYADAPQGYYRTSSISQIGKIPKNTTYIDFSLLPVYGDTNAPTVTIGGTTIAVSEVSTGANGVETWSGNVSAFAGLVEPLSFAALGQYNINPTGSDTEVDYELDDISFQTPEPATLTASLLCATTMLLRRPTRRSPRHMSNPFH